MNRRRLLRGLAGACVLATAGCAGGGGDSPAGDGSQGTTAAGETATATATPTDTASPTATDSPADTETATPADTEAPSPTEDSQASPTPAPAVADQSLAVTDSGCGQPVDDAAVAFDGDSVTVTGTIWGNDLGYTAVLDAVEREGDRLVVTVAARRRETTETVAAGQCISEINYEAVVTVAGDLPSTVVVRHRHGEDTTTVATVER